MIGGIGPNELIFLIFVFLLVLIIILRWSKQKTQKRLERELLALAKSKGGEITLEEVAVSLGISITHAQELLRKIITEGEVKIEEREGKEVYVFPGLTKSRKEK